MQDQHCCIEFISIGNSNYYILYSDVIYSRFLLNNRLSLGMTYSVDETKILMENNKSYLYYIFKITIKQYNQTYFYIIYIFWGVLKKYFFCHHIGKLGGIVAPLIFFFIGRRICPASVSSALPPSGQRRTCLAARSQEGSRKPRYTATRPGRPFKTLGAL